MKLKIRNIGIFLLALIGITACSKQEDSAFIEDSVTSAPFITAAVQDTQKNKIRISSSESYRSYAVVTIALPQDYKAEDVQSIDLGIYCNMPLQLRLYAGEYLVECDDNSELTQEDSSWEDTVIDNEIITTGQEEISKQVHSMKRIRNASTRLYPESQTEMIYSVPMLENAKQILSQFQGESFQLAIYCHNKKPVYDLYKLQINTADGSFEIPLAVDEITGYAGAVVELVP